MTTLRRLVMLVLLFTVPLQAAVGATGYVCGHGAHHVHPPAIASQHPAATHAHRHAAVSHEYRSFHAEHSHGTQASMVDAVDRAVDASRPILANPQSHGYSSADTCEFCNECSFSLAPVSDAAPNIIRPVSSSRVSFYVDPSARPHVGDALFRPPRSIRS